MKNFAKSKEKRITAALLCAVMCIMSLPLSAFAFTAEEGKTVNAYYGDKYVSADGEMYFLPQPISISPMMQTAMKVCTLKAQAIREPS